MAGSWKLGASTSDRGLTGVVPAVQEEPVEIRGRLVGVCRHGLVGFDVHGQRIDRGCYPAFKQR